MTSFVRFPGPTAGQRCLAVLLAPYDDQGAFAGRIRVAVPRMGIGEATAKTLAMIVHELATNSVKHGALSSPTGALDITSSSDNGNISIVWAETGGPAAIEPSEMRGFGSRMISRSITYQLGGAVTYDWGPAGLVVTLRMQKGRLAR